MDTVLYTRNSPNPWNISATIYIWPVNVQHRCLFTHLQLFVYLFVYTLRTVLRTPILNLTVLINDALVMLLTHLVGLLW